MLSKELIKRRFKILKAEDIFSQKNIDKSMTFEKFLEIRKNSMKFVPIEDFINNERYGGE